ncbi:hypothetical protein K440DRAFT_642540 [Wilcoxina mikolae CBS 423.85]|nr:hypothetical protein K440DRAFT_642540 [Wilcoxina mikolae CBS 423.85]
MNDPGGERVSWAAEPTGRGTFGLLRSCSITVIMCVWTALHLNVEPRGKGTEPFYGVSRFISKLLMAFIALVAPELVLAIALHQFLVAWRFRRVVNEYVTTPIGMDKAFYAVMGGFATEKETKLVTLNLKTLMTVSLMESVACFSINEIRDKSKATAVVTIVACVQAGWILMQCVGRKKLELYITLLEFNTMMHVINAIIMYAIWWRKPVDVTHPSVLVRIDVPRDPDSIGLAKSLLRSAIASVHDSRGVTKAEELVHDLQEIMSPEIFQALSGTNTVPNPNPAAETQTQTSRPELPRDRGTQESCVTITEGETQQRTPQIAKESNWQRLASTFSIDLVTNQLADIPGLFKKHRLSERKRYGPFGRSWQIRHRAVLAVFAGTSGAFYGSIHATRWNAVFPTPLERILWRISCCVGSVGILPIMVLGMIGFITNRYLRAACITIGTCIGLVFLAARAYLVVESFLNVRSLPVNAYTTLSWMNLWPHL